MTSASRSCWRSGIVLAAAIAASAAHAALPNYCVSAPVRIALQGENGMTGGTIEFGFSVTNLGKVACRLQGLPLVRVPSLPYPVVVGAIFPDFPGNGKSTPFELRAGATAHAAILVARPCEGSRSMMTAGAVAVGFGNHWAKLQIQACKKEGSEIDVGRFEQPATK